MSLESILSSIDVEISQLKLARALLAGVTTEMQGAKSTARQSQKPKRTMSAAARKRIAAAQRKRWAKLKRAK